MYSRLHALYVDDDTSGCELMKTWLTQRFGFDVLTASNAQEAGRMIGGRPFDLYLIDYCLPDVTAVSLCEQILGSNRGGQIVVYTALDRDIDREHALRAGARSFFVKPDQINELQAEIRAIIDGLGTVPLRQSPGLSHHFFDRQRIRRPRWKAAGVI